MRVHTCFNRLDLPEYPDKLSLETAVKFALENQVLGYGIEWNIKIFLLFYRF